MSLVSAHIKAVLGATAIAFVIPAFAQQAPIVAAGTPGNQAARSVLDEVLVTARRRDEQLQDVPLSISVVEAAVLDETGSFNVGRLQQLAPSLQFYSSNPRNSAANIRGFGAPFGLTNDGIEQGVGLYVDDVYYSRAASSTLDFLDVDRLEILRGPQGTLYGKNTTAGAINITTRAPTFAPEGRVEVTAGNLDFYQAKAALSGPLVADKVAGRLALSTTTRRGTVFNTASGTYINELDNIGVRGQLLFKASDNLDVTLAADYNKQDPEGYAQIATRYGVTQRGANRQYFELAAIADGDPFTPGVQPYVAPGTDLVNRTFSPFDRVTDVDAELSARSELGGAALRAVWDLGAGTFTSVTAWRYWDWLPKNDRDFTGLPVTTKSENPSHQDQYTQEFRYAWTGDRIDYVVGLFGYKQTVHTDGVQEQGPAASRWLLHPSTQPEATLALDPAVLNGLTSYNDIDFSNTSAALFGQLSWKVTDQFRVEPGLRLNYDDKKGSYVSRVINGQGETLQENPNSTFYTAGDALDPYILPNGTPSATITRGQVRLAQRGQLTPQHYEAEFDDWNVSGSLTLAYDFTADILGYATYGRGFKTGGITLNGAPTNSNGDAIVSATTVDPEKVNQYELGLKTQFLGRRGTLNLALFRTDVDDFQATVNNNGQGVSNIRGFLANAEKVRVQGVEVDFSYRPSDNWNLYANGALTDHEWVSFPEAPCPPELSGNSTLLAPGATPQPATPGAPSPASCNISGQWLPGISKLAGSWGFQYDHPSSFLGKDGAFYFGYDGSARSKWSSNASRSIYTDVAGYGLSNFRFGFRSSDSWNAYVWVKNAFDKDYIEILQAGTGGNTGLIAGQFGDPRTFGLTIRADF